MRRSWQKAEYHALEGVCDRAEPMAVFEASSALPTQAHNGIPEDGQIIIIPKYVILSIIFPFEHVRPLFAIKETI